ncbi:TPA: hypothetical protein ACPZLS_000012 [Yersinia enterocolitica]
MNNIEELKKAALGANLHGWTGFEDALNADGYSEAVSKFIGHCRPSEILALIAQLEAAQKERDEFRLAFQQNEQAKQELFAQKDLLITANLNISRRAEKAEAELSAANEKLSKPVVLPIKYNPAVAGNKSTRANFIWHNDAISYCADAIKAAGFTVEE